MADVELKVQRTDTMGVSYFSDEEVKERRAKVEEAFDIFDSDHDGYIVKSELKMIIRLLGQYEDKESLDIVFKEMDSQDSTDGRVTKAEFMASMEEFNTSPVTNRKLLAMSPAKRKLAYMHQAILLDEVARLKRAFLACDVDGSGAIDEKELVAVLTALGETMSKKKIDRLFSKLDRSNDRSIDFQEFLRFMVLRKKSKKNRATKYFNVDTLNYISTFMQERNVTDYEQARAFKKLLLLERIGANWMKRYYRSQKLATQRAASPSRDARSQYQIAPSAKRDILRIERWALFFDALLGLASATIAWGLEFFATDRWCVTGFEIDQSRNDCTTTLEFRDRLIYYWLVVGGTAVIASALEIILIYYTHLRAAVSISQIADLKLFPVDNERAFVASALARAALELPQPTKEEFGINPLKEASKARLVFASVVYKAKTGLTSFILRLVLKRVLARTAVKFLGLIVAAPVTMLFNLFVGYKTIRAVRVSALGPSAATSITDELIARKDTLTYLVRTGMVRAVACGIVASQHMHPNVRILLRHITTKVNMRLTEHKDTLFPDDEVAEDEKQLDVQEDTEDGMAEAGWDTLSNKEREARAAAGVSSRSTSNLTTASNAQNDGVQSDDAKSQNGEEKKQQVDSDANNDDDDDDDHDLDDEDDEAGAESKVFTEPSAVSSKSSFPEELPTPRLKRFVGRVVQTTLIEDPGDRKRFLDLLNDVGSREDQKFLVVFLAFVLVLDGYINATMLKFFKDACDVAGLSNSEWPLRWLGLQFLGGELVSQDVWDLFDRETEKSGCYHRMRHALDRIGVWLAF